MVQLSVLTEIIYLQKQFSEDILLGPSLFFAKLSLLLLYLRIFGLKKFVRWTIYFALVFAICLYWINIPTASYYCAPRAGKNWDLEELGFKCYKSMIFGLVQGSFNVILDLFIFILPIPVVMGLQMTALKTLAILTVFLTGAL